MKKILVMLALAAAGCAALEPNPALEAARTDVRAAASNPDVVARAPHELRRAQEALAQAEREWLDKNSTAEVNHKAYLAHTRAVTAMDLARARSATDELQTAQVEVDRLRLAARERDAASAQAEAQRQALAANSARADAARANQDAARANQDAAAAASAAAADRDRAMLAEQQAREARDSLAAMQTRIIEIEGKQTERGILVTLGDVLFEFDKAVLLPVAEPRLDRLANFLKQFPEKKLLVEGYTDAIGSDSYNRDLSRRRAEAVHAALVRRGVDPARMSVEGYGKAFPVADNSNPTGRQMNRRVEVVVSDEKGNLQPRA
jgi:outer membrane protein OmpA-like peptidoglycan-associated protein